MKDYAKRAQRPQVQTRKPARASDGNGLLILFIFFSAFFLIYTTYHFIHTHLLAEKNPAPITIAPQTHNEKQTAPVLVEKNSPADKMIKKIKQIHQTITLKKSENADTTTAIKLPKNTPLKKAVIAQPATPTDNEPKYDFYQLLPKMTVVIPNESESPASPTTVNLNTHTKSAYYVLQIASLQSQSDAKEVELTLKNGGFPAYMQSYEAKHITWYRVMVGPIATLKAAQTIQNKLYAHQMMAVMSKVQK